MPLPTAFLGWSKKVSLNLFSYGRHPHYSYFFLNLHLGLYLLPHEANPEGYKSFSLLYFNFKISIPGSVYQFSELGLGDKSKWTFHFSFVPMYVSFHWMLSQKREIAHSSKDLSISVSSGQKPSNIKHEPNFQLLKFIQCFTKIEDIPVYIHLWGKIFHWQTLI